MHISLHKLADPLLQPYQLRHLTLRNRFMSTAHEPSYSEDGMPKDRYRLYHVEKAKGGIALTMTAGSAVVSPDSPPVFGNLLAYKDEIVPWLRRLTDECHDHGSAVMIQLTHLGRRTAWNKADWLPILAPSMVREPAHRGFPKAMEAWDIDRVVAETLGRPVRFVHASGPAKAFEIARGVLTLMCFAGSDADARFCRDAMSAAHMRIDTTDDIAGAEICSAMKNAYATGLGLWDGLVGADCHNARAACFSQGILEMAKLVRGGGGRAETVFGAPGVGDLHVTAAAGRNRAFGEGVGKGKPAKQVAAETLAKLRLTVG